MRLAACRIVRAVLHKEFVGPKSDKLLGAIGVAAFFIALVCAPGALAQAPTTSSGQAYPTKAIRMIMPFAPGGGLEAQARVVTQKLAEAWGQPVIIDSRPGANGMVGIQMAAGAAPDGYTLMFTNRPWRRSSAAKCSSPSSAPT